MKIEFKSIMFSLMFYMAGVCQVAVYLSTATKEDGNSLFVLWLLFLVIGFLLMYSSGDEE